MAKAEELYQKAEEWSEKADELFKESDQLREEADDVWRDCEGRQGEIDDMKAEANQLVQEFRSLFQQSQEAYDDGDGALAKELSLEGHEKQDECKGINEEVGELIRDLKEVREELFRLNREAKGKREEAFRCIEEARRLRQQAKSQGDEWEHSNVHPPTKDERFTTNHIDIHHQNILGKRDRPHSEDVKISYDRSKPRVRDIWPPRKKK